MLEGKSNAGNESNHFYLTTFAILTKKEYYLTIELNVSRSVVNFNIKRKGNDFFSIAKNKSVEMNKKQNRFTKAEWFDRKKVVCTAGADRSRHWRQKSGEKVKRTRKEEKFPK